MSNLWSLDNPVFTDYVFYASVMAAKVLIMVPITGYYRMTRKAFANPEDAKSFGGKDSKVNEDVERVRRIHQNDLENVPIFWIVGLLYTLTNPSQGIARMAFRAFTFSRIAYLFLYISGSNKRPLSFLVGVFANVFMIFNIIKTFM